MTQPPRSTESISRDHETLRDIMHQIRDRLTVPDRATLALGLIGHLATLMNRRQMDKLLAQLQEEAEKVQDVPPSRGGDGGSRAAARERHSEEAAQDSTGQTADEGNSR